MVRATSAGPQVHVVTAAGWPAQVGSEIEIFGRDGQDVSDPGVDGLGAEILVFAHQHSPDFERWDTWRRRGELRGHRLVLTEGEGAPVQKAEPLRLMERLRRQRDLAKACRRGLARSGAQPGPVA